MNEPPLEPVTLVPTFPATPLTALTASVSPSGSVSSAPSVRTLPVAVAFSVVEPLSSVAVGAGLATFQVKVCEVAAPLGSVPVIVTEYGPVTLALAAIVPVMTPVVGWMLSPGGSPADVNVNVSLPSGSLKLAETSSVTTCESVLFCGARAVEVGASFVPVTVTVTVVVAVPPLPSLTS